MCRDGRGLGSKLVSFAKGFSKHPHILAIFKVDSEYLRFPFKVKVDYFILYSILVSTFVIFLLLFSTSKRKTHKRSVPAIMVSFAKGFSKHPHIFPIFKMVSEYSRLLFKLKVDYFILNSRFYLRNFASVFCYEEKKMHGRSREQFFYSNRRCTCSSVNRNERQTINMLSLLRNRPDISYQRQH